MTVDDENEQDEAESGPREEDMETSHGGEMTTERLQSTYHSSEMALAFERMVSLGCAVLLWSKSFVAGV